MSVTVDLRSSAAPVPVVRFKSAANVNANLVNNEIDVAKPLIDDRAPATQPVILGMKPSQTVSLTLERLALDSAAPLTVRSTQTAVVSVASPAGGTIPAGATATVELRSGAATSDSQAEIEVVHGSVVIHKLRVDVRPLLRVGLGIYRVNVNAPGFDPENPQDVFPGAGAPGPEIERILARVNAIWAPAAVEFVPQDGGASVVDVTCTENDRVNFHSSSTDMATVMANRLPNRINVYFVRMLVFRLADGSEPASPVGATISETSRTERGLPGVCIILANQPWEDSAQTMAHEFGHLLSLQHPYTPPAGDRERTTGTATRAISPYFLMHWTTPIGHFLPMKRVPSGTDGLNDNGVAEARAEASNRNYVLAAAAAGT